MNGAPLTLRWGVTRRQLCLFESRLLWVNEQIAFCRWGFSSVLLISRFLLWAGLALLTVSCLLRCRCWICTGSLLRGKQTGQQEEREESWQRGKRFHLKDVWDLLKCLPRAKMSYDCSVMTFRRWARGWKWWIVEDKKKRSLPALTVSSRLVLWPPCPQCCPTKTPSSLQPRKQQLKTHFFFQLVTFIFRQKIKQDWCSLSVLTWWDRGSWLCSDGTGWHWGVRIRRYTLSQLLQLHPNGNQIWRTQLAIYMFKLLHLQKKKKKKL